MISESLISRTLKDLFCTTRLNSFTLCSDLLRLRSTNLTCPLKSKVLKNLKTIPILSNSEVTVTIMKNKSLKRDHSMRTYLNAEQISMKTDLWLLSALKRLTLVN